MSEKLIKCAVEGDDIVIRVSIDDLVSIVETDPTFAYKVHDKKQFAKEMVFELEESRSYSNNDGINAVEELFQNAYEKVYEQGEYEVMTGEEIY